MVKASELRSGNVLFFLVGQVNGDFKPMATVITAKQIAIMEETDNKTDDFWVPIPLSHEILEKNGFVKLDHSEYYCFEKWMDKGTLIEISITLEGEVYYDTPKTQIKLPLKYPFLHQLQNLTYFLTGTEINYTP